MDVKTIILEWERKQQTINRRHNIIIQLECSINEFKVPIYGYTLIYTEVHGQDLQGRGLQGILS